MDHGHTDIVDTQGFPFFPFHEHKLMRAEMATPYAAKIYSKPIALLKDFPGANYFVLNGMFSVFSRYYTFTRNYAKRRGAPHVWL